MTTLLPAFTDSIGMVCPTAPERIWLQVDPEPEDEGKPVYPTNPSQDDVTWCWDKINATDTLYIRADLILAASAAPAPEQPNAGAEDFHLAGNRNEAATDWEAERARQGAECTAFNEWWESSGQGAEPLHTVIVRNAAGAAWQERASRAVCGVNAAAGVDTSRGGQHG